MVKDLHYIIKRILIGVGIALCMYFFRNYLFLNTYALEVSNYGIGNTEAVIDNTTTYYQKDISGNPWSTFAGMSGYVNGSFALQKINGTSTSINVFPTQIFISTNTGYQDYVCDIGTAMEGNSTFNGGTFTYRCPIKMGTNGVTRIVFQFQNIQTNYPSEYRLSIGSSMSFEVVEDTNVNVDTSGTTNAINNQTQSNNHNRDANFGNLINDNRDNTQDIIDNQNSNTDKQIESQKVCDKKVVDYENSTTSVNGKYFINSNGGLSSGSLSWKITDYYDITDYKSIVISDTYTANAYSCFYNDSKQLISCIQQVNGNVTIPTNAKYIKFSIRGTNQPTFTIDYCINGNQAIVDSQKDINNTLNDSSTSDPNSDISNMSQKVASNNSITQLLTLPITLFQNVLNNINGSCSSYSLGSLYGHNLTLPCINLENILGSTLWGIIDVLISGLFILSFRKKMVDIFNHMSSLNDRGNELE